MEKPVLERSSAEPPQELSSVQAPEKRVPTPSPVNGNPPYLQPVEKQPRKEPSPSVPQSLASGSVNPANPNSASSQDNKPYYDRNELDAFVNYVTEHLDEIVRGPRQAYKGSKNTRMPNNEKNGQKPGNQQYGQRPGNQQYGQRPGNQQYGQRPNSQPYGQKPHPSKQKPGNPNNAATNTGKESRELFHVSSSLNYSPSLHLVELVFSLDPLSPFTVLTRRSSPHRSLPMEQRYMLSVLTPLYYDHYPAIWLSHTNRILLRPFDILCCRSMGS